MKTIIWLYIFLFIAFFDLHAQYPLLSPFAISLGATPAFIGLMMGVYAFAHIPGNLFAGRAVDRHGSRLFIAASLVCAGLILVVQAFVEDPWQLLVIRSLSGFVLAFLAPACQALLARLGQTAERQGRLLAGSGIVHMLASVVSPTVGALFVARFGFKLSFLVLGCILMLTGALAGLILATVNSRVAIAEPQPDQAVRNDLPIPKLVFAAPLALAFSQGILFFELPLRENMSSAAGMYHSGLMFALVSVGAGVTLSMMFLQRTSAFTRTLAGTCMLALLFYLAAFETLLSFPVLLVLIGMAKGVIYPAVSTMLATLVRRDLYGRAFAYLSVSYSLGAFLGPLAASQLRSFVSPYFLAFLLLLAAGIVIGSFHRDCSPSMVEG